jgi:hypothetical protein
MKNKISFLCLNGGIVQVIVYILYVSIHIKTKILELIHSKNYTKKQAKVKKIHGHIKDKQNLKSEE